LSPTEDRFIELYNTGSSSVDLTDWYVQRKTTGGSTFGSLVSKTNFLGKSIGAGSYFLISKSQIDNSDIVVDNLTLTESNTIQLKNGNQDVVDKVGWGDASDCMSACAPNPTAGKSISITSSGEWIIASRTPGLSNSNTINDGDSGSDDTGGTTDGGSTSHVSTSSSLKKEVVEIFKISTKIILPKTITAGIPFAINSLTNSNKGDTYAVGRWVWNFGDGSSSKVDKSSPFEYLYEYAGDYALTLSYFDNSFSKVPVASDRVIVKVVSSELFVSSVGGYADPYVELENKSNYEIVLSDWVVTAGIHYFIIPEGTTLLPNKKMKLSPKITGFVGEDIRSVVVTDPNKEITASYPAEIKKPIQKILPSMASTYSNQVSTIATPKEDVLPEGSQVINLNEMEASAGDSGIVIPSRVYPFVGLLVVVCIGIASFVIIKKRQVRDYVEDGIRAEDMTIVE
jgi:hypothetical protein